MTNHEGSKTRRVGLACRHALRVCRAAGAGPPCFCRGVRRDEALKLRGVVTKVEWINPHAWIHIDVKRPDGSAEQWMIEGGTPNTLFRRGVNKNSLPPGTEILVDGYQAKDGTMKANGRDITFPDGRKLFIGSTGTGAPGDPQPTPQK